MRLKRMYNVIKRIFIIRITMGSYIDSRIGKSFSHTLVSGISLFMYELFSLFINVLYE